MTKHSATCGLCGEEISGHGNEMRVLSERHLKDHHPKWWKRYKNLVEKIKAMKDEADLWFHFT